MSPSEIEQYLHEHIPLSKAMQASVVALEADSVVLRAPLAPNINHRDTVFGGSASALAILAAWSLIHVRLHNEGISSRIVIHRNTMNYDLPIPGEFTARASLKQPGDWARFTRILKRHGKGRITVNSALEYAGHVTGRFTGEFVALDAHRA